ncbi:MAG: LytTR family DNA-binding domain-containing protein [Ginsengibacter sp.]
MKPIRCMAVDDEPWALALVADYIKKIPFLELIYKSNSPIDALEYLQHAEVDLLFLDIQMPELTGMQFLRISQNKMPVILTTAYSEYALEGYEHNVVDYLLKPISFDRFYKAAEKARQMILGNQKTPETVFVQPENVDDFIFIKTDNKLVRVSFDDILYVEGLKDYLSVVTRTEKLITLQSLKNMEELLPAQNFLRVHKSYIIAINKIDTLEKNRIFIGEAVIPIGETYKEDFSKRISG